MYEDIFLYFKPEVVVVEKINVAGISFGANNVLKLAQLQAMIRLLCQQHNVRIYEVNPTTMKKSLSGYGKSEKIEIAKIVASRWKLNVDSICIPILYKRKEGIKGYVADESDAIALGTYYIDFVSSLDN